MYRSRLVLLVSLLSLVLSLSACKSGPSDPASYRSAMKGLTPAMTKLAMTTRDASTAGDPMQLSSALQKTLASAKSVHALCKKLEVSEASLAGLHADLLAATASHVAALEEAAGGAKSTPIPETKGLMNDSNEELLEAVQAWNDGLDAL